MKTSYVPKNVQGSQRVNSNLDKDHQSIFSPNAESGVGDSDISASVESAYKDIAMEVEKRNQGNGLDEEPSRYDSLEEDEYDEDDDDEDEEEPVRKEKSDKPLIIGVCIGISVILIGGLGFGLYLNNQNKLVEAQKQEELAIKQASDNYNEIKQKISDLYVDAKKADIKDDVTQSTLDDYRAALQKIKIEDTSEAVKELDTIGYFLNDKGILNGYNSDSYNLDSAGLIDNVNSIKNRTGNYSVSSLVLTINELGSKIVNDYNYYKNLSDELENYTDFINFDEGGYKTKIDAVTHTPNKDVLMGIYNKRVADKKAAEINQRIIDATDDEVRAQAQAELEQAQTVQGQMQNELDALKQQLKSQMEQAVTTPEPEQTAEPTEATEAVDTPAQEETKDTEVTEPDTSEETTESSDSVLDDLGEDIFSE